MKTVDNRQLKESENCKKVMMLLTNSIVIIFLHLHTFTENNYSRRIMKNKYRNDNCNIPSNDTTNQIA